MSIRDKYADLGLYEGAAVKVYSVDKEGADAIILTINRYGNIIVQYDETQYMDDDDQTPYSAQVVHPRQVELVK